MSWETEMVEMVRILIDDTADTPVYEDNRLERAIIVAAYQLVQEASFDVTYTVSIRPASISPDPTDVTVDAGFVNLWALKSACIMLQGEYRKFALTSVQITDGPSSISTAGRINAIKNLHDTLTAKYEITKARFQGGKIGQAITTPTTVSNVYPFQEF